MAKEKTKKTTEKKKVVKKATKKSKASVKKATKKSVAKKEVSSDSILKELLEAGCHFGHKRSRIDSKVKPYVYTIRDGIVIFDLFKTKEQIDKAKEFISKLVKEDKKIAFLGTKRQAREIVREEAKRVGMPFVVNRWLGGTITNWEEIKKNSIDKYNRLKKEMAEGKYKKRTKREQSLIRKEINRLEKIIGGLSNLDKIFDAMFVVDLKMEETAVKEARIKGIPIIAIVDSNCDPTLADYPIVANDDAAKSIQLLVNEIGKSIKED